MIDIELQRARSAMAESVTLPIAMWLEALDELEALRQTRLVQQAEQEPVAQQDSDDRRLLREVLMLCEATEELEPTNEFMRGRIFEAKGIRRGIGTWYQDTFCGRSYMCEPVLNAAPVEPVKAEQEPVAWHHPQCEGQCIACLIEKAVQDAYGTQGRDYMLRHINAAPVRTKDLTEPLIDELRECRDLLMCVESCSRNNFENLAYERVQAIDAVIAADRELNK